MDPSYNNGNGVNAGQTGASVGADVNGMSGASGMSGGIFSRAEDTSSIPGAKPGVIASGPDTPPVVEVPSNTTAGLSLGSRHLFKKPRAGTPNRNMVMNVGGGASAGGGTSRGPRRGIIIAGLVVVVILIVALVVGMMLTQNRGGGSNTQIATGDDADFYRYANYILNGEESTSANLGEYSRWTDYALTTAFDERNVDFFNKANDLWKTFYEKINTSERTEITDFTGNVEYQNQLMDFAVKYMNTQELDDDALLKIYLENGTDNAKNKVDEYYAKLLDTTFLAGGDYATTLSNYAKTTIDLLSAYDSRGCIVNNEINYSCVSRNGSALESINAEYVNRRQDIAYSTVNRVMMEIEEFCFKIKDSMGSENEK